MWHQLYLRCKYTTSVDIQKRAIEKLFTHVESQASDQQQQQQEFLEPVLITTL